MNKPVKPTMPLNRVRRSSGDWGVCPKCQSGLVFRKYFGLPACLQEQCEDYYGYKMTLKQLLTEVIKLCRRKVGILNGGHNDEAKADIMP